MRISQSHAESMRQTITGWMKDYTGTQKGMLLLLWPTTERVSHSGVKWAAKCQCGSYAVVLPCASGTYSCGCHRIAVSTESGKSKRALSSEQVRLLRSSNKTPKQLAYDLGISLSTISSIKSGRRYADVI